MPAEPLYRRLLGERFEDLPGALRRFHDAPGGGRARGTFKVVRAPGRLRKILAIVMDFPRPGAQVAVDLQVVVEGDRERWVRHFDGQRMISVQWARGTDLMERAGPVSFLCTLSLEGPRLNYVFQRVWFAGIPLHRSIAPFVESHAEGDDRGWWVLVRIFVPILGELISYEGWIEPQ